MPGILVGYARTSTCDQQAGLDAQVRDLKVDRLRGNLLGAGLRRGTA